jgi:organic hydroperoxide reductase OsmC/OhrA
VLRPRVTIAAGADAELAQRLHDGVDELCFIARSVNFPVRHEPSTVVAG